jgi:UDP-glucose 4-epimerase
MKSYVFRLANVIGGRSTHGVIFDFINKLKANPDELEILGDGTQNKSYIHIEDCVKAIIDTVQKSEETFQVFNIGSDDQTDVKSIGRVVSEELETEPEFKFTGGDRGWKGDVPKMMLDTSKIKGLNWSPNLNSEDAVRKTVREILGKE